MNEFPFTEADLKAAAIAVSDSLLTSLPKPDEIEHEFSEGFLNKMDALLALDKRRQRARSIARRAAMIVLTILVTLGAWLAVDTDARAAIMKWARELSDNGFAYRFFRQRNWYGIARAFRFPRYALRDWMVAGRVRRPEPRLS